MTAIVFCWIWCVFHVTLLAAAGAMLTQRLIRRDPHAASMVGCSAAMRLLAITLLAPAPSPSFVIPQSWKADLPNAPDAADVSPAARKSAPSQVSPSMLQLDPAHLLSKRGFDSNPSSDWWWTPRRAFHIAWLVFVGAAAVGGLRLGLAMCGDCWEPSPKPLISIIHLFTTWCGG